MGKAAILVGPAVVIVLGLIVWGIVRSIIKSNQEPRSVRQNAELADDAYEMFKDMLYPKFIDNMTILSEDDKAKIKSWAEKYRKVNS